MTLISVASIKNYLLCISFILLYSQAFSQNTSLKNDDFLFAITEYGKWGYMDTLGKVVIPPKYEEAHDFSEGLGLVRENGLYGFINKKGIFQIQPQYYYAYPFHNGFALVFSKYGNPDYIEKSSKIAFKSDYKEAKSFFNGLAVVKTFTDKYGMINSEGNLFLDTVYSEIQYSFDKKFFLATGLLKNISKEGLTYENDIALYSSSGRLIVPHLTYSTFFTYNSVRERDFFFAELPKKSKDKTGSDIVGAILDSNNTLIASFDTNRKLILNGSAKLIPKKDTGYLDRIQFKSGNDIYLISNDNNLDIIRFNHGSALYNEKNKFYVINKEGKIISEKSYTSKDENYMTNSPFHIGLNNFERFLIDSLGNEVKSFHSTDDVNLDRLHFYSYQGSITYSSEDGNINSPKNEDNMPSFHNYIQCFDLNGDPITGDNLLDYDRDNGFVHGLLKADVDGKLTFFNEKGKIVWSDTTSGLCDYNFTFQKSAFYSLLENIDKRIIKVKDLKSKIPDLKLDKKDFSIVVSNDVNQIIKRKYHAQTFWLCNNTKKDKKIYITMGIAMVVEAKDDKGIWREIEKENYQNYYLSCARGIETREEFEKNNVYTIKKKTAIEFKFPKYNGAFKTKLRIRLDYTNPLNESDKRSIYSPDFEGNINYAQFWKPHNSADQFMIDYLR